MKLFATVLRWIFVTIALTVLSAAELYPNRISSKYDGLIESDNLDGRWSTLTTGPDAKDSRSEDSFKKEKNGAHNRTERQALLREFLFDDFSPLSENSNDGDSKRSKSSNKNHGKSEGIVADEGRLGKIWDHDNGNIRKKENYVGLRKHEENLVPVFKNNPTSDDLNMSHDNVDQSEPSSLSEVSHSDHELGKKHLKKEDHINKQSNNAQNVVKTRGNEAESQEKVSSVWKLFFNDDVDKNGETKTAVLMKNTSLLGNPMTEYSGKKRKFEGTDGNRGHNVLESRQLSLEGKHPYRQDKNIFGKSDDDYASELEDFSTDTKSSEQAGKLKDPNVGNQAKYLYSKYAPGLYPTAGGEDFAEFYPQYVLQATDNKAGRQASPGINFPVSNLQPISTARKKHGEVQSKKNDVKSDEVYGGSRLYRKRTKDIGRQTKLKYFTHVGVADKIRTKHQNTNRRVDKKISGMYRPAFYVGDNVGEWKYTESVGEQDGEEEEDAVNQRETSDNTDYDSINKTNQMRQNELKTRLKEERFDVNEKSFRADNDEGIGKKQNEGSFSDVVVDARENSFVSRADHSHYLGNQKQMINGNMHGIKTKRLGFGFQGTSEKQVTSKKTTRTERFGDVGSLATDGDLQTVINRSNTLRKFGALKSNKDSENGLRETENRDSNSKGDTGLIRSTIGIGGNSGDPSSLDVISTNRGDNGRKQKVNFTRNSNSTTRHSLKANTHKMYQINNSTPYFKIAKHPLRKDEDMENVKDKKQLNSRTFAKIGYFATTNLSDSSMNGRNYFLGKTLGRQSKIISSQNSTFQTIFPDEALSSDFFKKNGDLERRKEKGTKPKSNITKIREDRKLKGKLKENGTSTFVTGKHLSNRLLSTVSVKKHSTNLKRKPPNMNKPNKPKTKVHQSGVNANHMQNSLFSRNILKLEFVEKKSQREAGKSIPIKESLRLKEKVRPSKIAHHRQNQATTLTNGAVMILGGGNTKIKNDKERRSFYKGNHLSGTKKPGLTHRIIIEQSLPETGFDLFILRVSPNHKLSSLKASKFNVQGSLEERTNKTQNKSRKLKQRLSKQYKLYRVHRNQKSPLEKFLDISIKSLVDFFRPYFLGKSEASDMKLKDIGRKLLALSSSGNSSSQNAAPRQRNNSKYNIDLSKKLKSSPLKSKKHRINNNYYSRFSINDHGKTNLNYWKTVKTTPKHGMSVDSRIAVQRNALSKHNRLSYYETKNITKNHTLKISDYDSDRINGSKNKQNSHERFFDSNSSESKRKMAGVRFQNSSSTKTNYGGTKQSSYDKNRNHTSDLPNYKSIGDKGISVNLKYMGVTQEKVALPSFLTRKQQKQFYTSPVKENIDVFLSENMVKGENDLVEESVRKSFTPRGKDLAFPSTGQQYDSSVMAAKNSGSGVQRVTPANSTYYVPLLAGKNKNVGGEDKKQKKGGNISSKSDSMLRSSENSNNKMTLRSVIGNRASSNQLFSASPTNSIIDDTYGYRSNGDARQTYTPTGGNDIVSTGGISNLGSKSDSVTATDNQYGSYVESRVSRLPYTFHIYQAYETSKDNSQSQMLSKTITSYKTTSYKGIFGNTDEDMNQSCLNIGKQDFVHFCPSGWVNYKQFCFLVVDVATRWTEVPRLCSRWSGKMAMPKSQDVLAFLADKLTTDNQYSRPHFVGLRKKDEKWEWIDDTPLSQALTDSEDADFHSCAVIQEGSLRKTQCDVEGAYICELQQGIEAVRVLAFGDSLTKGYYNNGKSFHPYGHKLGEMLNKDNHRCFVLEISGQNERRTFNWVIILSGTNDLLVSSNPGERIADEVIIMHEVVHARGAKSMVVTIPEIFCERTSCVGVKERRTLANQRLRIYAEAAGSKAFLSDIALQMSLHQLSLEDRTAFWEPFGVHMKPKGYDRMAEIIFKDLMESIESPS